MDGKAAMATASINDLPDSKFAYIEPGGTKDDTGKTVPRSKRHFPIHDAAHVRNALSRLAQSPFGEKARAKVEAAAAKFGITVGKAWPEEMKAEPLNTVELDRWLSGERSRRVLVIPFTGPLPGGKAGLDLDGEYFDEETDLYGDYPYLRRTRERLVDWHHDQDPTGKMKGAILGKAVLDVTPEADGLWADFWANAGEKRRDLIARLESAGIPLYGSSEPVQAGVRKAKDGHIDRWPIIRHTITTSPQNTHALVPALKAVWTGADAMDSLTVAAFMAAAEGEGYGPFDALASRPGNVAGKTDSRTRLETVLDDLRAALAL